MIDDLNIAERLERQRAELTQRRQLHVLRYWDGLTSTQKTQLLDDLESIPWRLLDPVIPTHVLRKPDRRVPDDLEPAPTFPPHSAPNQATLYNEARKLGQNLIHAGKVAAFTVAGGQATRLGFDGPKGIVPVTPVSGKSLFQLFAEMVLAARKKYGSEIPWYIMTSPANHEATVFFLSEHRFFGLPQEDVVLFSQGMLPAFDYEGRLLLEGKHRLAMAPDGHGGSLKAVVASGALDDMRRRGIEIISYFQVDNPLVKPFDPLFIGLHAKTGSEMSTKVTPKADDLERVGNVCMGDGRVMVVEYSELSNELARAKNPDGTRKFDAANIAVHLFEVDFIDRVIAQSYQLPFRRAEKIVPYIDERGELCTPAAPNALKLETFVFDILPLARNPLVLEVDRAEEFSPVKNATGVDSLETAKRDQIARACRWLEGAGETVPRDTTGHPDAVVELAPTFALSREEVADRFQSTTRITPGAHVYLD